MSTTSQVTTFQDLYRDLENRARVVTGVTATEDQAKRYCNIALHDMHISWGEHFWWAHREAFLRTHAPYTTGTVTLTNTTTITGASTAWSTAGSFGENNMRAGGKFTIDGITVYEIDAIASDTSATLTTRYVGSPTTGGTTYTYFEDDYALDGDFLRPLDLSIFSSASEIPLIGPKEFRRRFPRPGSIRRKPQVATIYAKNPSSAVDVRTRVRLWPAPDDEYLIPYSFITNKFAVGTSGTLATNLSSDLDEPIVPLQYRHVIVLHALWHWFRDKQDDDRASSVKAERDELMTRIVGDTFIGSDRPVIRPRVGPIKNRAKRPWGGTGRYWVTGEAWDEFRQ